MIVFSSYISQQQIGHFMDIQSKKKKEQWTQLASIILLFEVITWIYKQFNIWIYHQRKGKPLKLE